MLNQSTDLIESILVDGDRVIDEEYVIDTLIDKVAQLSEHGFEESNQIIGKS